MIRAKAKFFFETPKNRRSLFHSGFGKHMMKNNNLQIKNWTVYNLKIFTARS